MTTAVQHRRGTTAEHSTFTGLEGEVTIDTTKDTAVIHDGAQAGGYPLAKETLSNANPSSLGALDGSSTASDDQFVIYDTSVSQLKKISRAELNNAITAEPFDTVDINGGTIDGTVIGGSSAAAGTFTSVNSTTAVSSTSLTTPLVIGGATTTSTLRLRSTSGVGTTGADIIFQTGNNGATEAMRILNSGNLGVGTATPSELVDIVKAQDGVTRAIIRNTSAGTAAQAQYQLSNGTSLASFGHAGASFTTAGVFRQDGSYISAAGAGGLTLNTSVSQPIYFGTASTERMRIDSTGRLLVTGGTTTGMTKQLNVYTAAEATVLLSADSTGELGMAFRDQTAGTNWGGIQAFNNSGSNRYIVFNNSGEKMRLDASGNLLLGTTSASERLTVSGNTALPAATTEQRYIKVGNGRTGNGFSYIDLIGDATYTTYGLRIIRNNAGANSISDISHRGTGDFYINTVDAAPILLRTSGTTRLRIDANGNVLNISAGGLGYGTGSGGAVTQATSRTTGVTLDKTNGAITLVSAAGTTTWQSFTVTNNTVAATDTIIVSQKSGADLYQIFVTAVANGSFRISFATTGGTTTEQPVFNFAVIKAVTA